MATHSCSCLEDPRDRGAWWTDVYGVTQSRTRLKWLSKGLPHCSPAWYQVTCLIQQVNCCFLCSHTKMDFRTFYLCEVYLNVFSFFQPLSNLYERAQSNLGSRSCIAYIVIQSVQSLSHVKLCDPMNRSTPGLPVHHQFPESTQTHVHWVGDVIQPSHPLSSPSPPALNLYPHQGLFKWVSSSHQVAKVLEFQLQHEFVQWTPKTNLL